MCSVIVVDDHPMVLASFKGLLEALEINVVGTAVDDIEFWNVMARNKQLPNVILLDIMLKTVEGSGFAMASKISAKYPSVKILAFSNDSNVYNIKQMYLNGAVGFIDKGANLFCFKDAITKIALGESYFLLSVLENGAYKYQHFKTDELLNICVPLNYTEKLFLQLLSTNLSYVDIAQKMKKSIHEIEYIRKAICTKINVHTRQELVLFAAKNGIA